jgi:hypothetical protein
MIQEEAPRVPAIVCASVSTYADETRRMGRTLEHPRGVFKDLQGSTPRARHAGITLGVGQGTRSIGVVEGGYHAQVRAGRQVGRPL